MPFSLSMAPSVQLLAVHRQGRGSGMLCPSVNTELPSLADIQQRNLVTWPCVDFITWPGRSRDLEGCEKIMFQCNAELHTSVCLQFMAEVSPATHECEAIQNCVASQQLYYFWAGQWALCSHFWFTLDRSCRHHSCRQPYTFPKWEPN